MQCADAGLRGRSRRVTHPLSAGSARSKNSRWGCDTVFAVNRAAVLRRQCGRSLEESFSINQGAPAPCSGCGSPARRLDLPALVKFPGDAHRSRTDRPGTRASGSPCPPGVRTTRRHRGVAAVALGWLVAASITLGCGRFSFHPQTREAVIAEGKRVFAERGCQNCHTIDPVGTPVAPDLRQTAARYREAALAQWLQRPSAQVPTRHMPELRLSEAEANAVAAYIATFR
jgi:mono/diheme cytochrome c family protein